LQKTSTVSVIQTDSLVNSVVKVFMKYMETKVDWVLIRMIRDYLRIWLALPRKKKKSAKKKKNKW